MMYSQERQYEQELMRLPDPLTKAEEKTATEDMLVIHNMRFAYVWGSSFANNNNLPRYDCIQEASIGLCEAAKRFNPEKGYKFITYAVWWIKQRLNVSMLLMRDLVRIPQNKTVKGERHMYFTLNEDEENELTDEYRPSMENRLADTSPSPFDDLVEEDQLSHLDRLMGCLDERDQDMMRMYHGLEGGQSLTYQEIGDIYGLSRERIRQITTAALKKMREKSQTII